MLDNTVADKMHNKRFAELISLRSLIDLSVNNAVNKPNVAFKAFGCSVSTS